MTRAAAAGAVTAAGLAVQRAWSARERLLATIAGATHRRDPEWLVLTVNRPPWEVTPDGHPPEPLARLGGAVEIRVRPAPGDRGSELAVRPTGADPGAQRTEAQRTEARRAARLALREAKQVLETGEVLGPTQPPTARPTLLGPLAYAVRHAREEGRL
jgi:hypothetical protein